MGANIAQHPVSTPEIKLWQKQSKTTQKQKSNYCCPVQFYWISLFCSKYFVQYCENVTTNILSQLLPQFFRISKAGCLSTNLRVYSKELSYKWTPSWKYLFLYNNYKLTNFQKLKKELLMVP